MSDTRCPYTYSNLVSVYYAEATRCSENKCSMAAIAMFWSAVDYAIKHELEGGSKLDPQTLLPRGSAKYKSQDLPGKLSAFWKLCPTLHDWNDRLLFFYRCVRNPFVHAKLDSIASSVDPETDGSTRTRSIESAHGETFPLGVEATIWSSHDEDDEEEEHRQKRRIHDEVLLIGSVEKAAGLAQQFATAFLKDLNLAVSQNKVADPAQATDGVIGDNSQVTYLHHLPLKAPLDLGAYTIWPYRAQRSQMIKTWPVREHLDKLFALMLNYRGKPLKHMAVITPKGQPDFKPQPAEAIEGMRDVLGALFLSTVLENSFMGSVASDNFTLIIQNFQPGSDGWATADGSYIHTTVGGLKLQDAGIRLPGYVPRPDQIHYDEELLAGCLACFSSSQDDLKKRIARSTRWVSHAYANVEHFPYQSRVLLLMIAFEILADLDPSLKADSFGEWLDKVWKTPDANKFPLTAPWAKPNVSYGQVGWWGVEFYKMRNAIVHDGDPHQQSAVDSLGREFFSTGVYVYSECLKELLREGGHMPASDDAIIRSWKLSKKPDKD